MFISQLILKKTGKNILMLMLVLVDQFRDFYVAWFVVFIPKKEDQNKLLHTGEFYNLQISRYRGKPITHHSFCKALPTDCSAHVGLTCYLLNSVSVQLMRLSIGKFFQ